MRAQAQHILLSVPVLYRATNVKTWRRLRNGSILKFAGVMPVPQSPQPFLEWLLQGLLGCDPRYVSGG